MTRFSRFLKKNWKSVVVVIVIPILTGMLVNYLTDAVKFNDLIVALRTIWLAIREIVLGIVHWLLENIVGAGLILSFVSILAFIHVIRSNPHSFIRWRRQDIVAELKNYIGRRDEQELLRSVLAQGQGPSVISIWGFPGVGKTALLEMAYLIGMEYKYHVLSPTKGRYQVYGKGESVIGFIARCVRRKPEGYATWSDTEKLKALADALPERSLLLIDEFQEIDASVKPMFLWFIRYLQSIGKRIVIILAGRERYDFLAEALAIFIWDDHPLVEFSKDELGQFLRLRFGALKITADVLNDLYRVTNGNAKLVEYLCANELVFDKFVADRSVGISLIDTLWSSLLSDRVLVDASMKCCLLGTITSEWPSRFGQVLIKDWNNVSDLLLRRSLITRSSRGYYRVSDILKEFVVPKTSDSFRLEVYSRLGIYIAEYLRQSQIRIPIAEQVSLVIMACKCLSFAADRANMIDLIQEKQALLESNGDLRPLGPYVGIVSMDDFRTDEMWADWQVFLAKVKIAESDYGTAEKALIQAALIYQRVKLPTRWIDANLILARTFRLCGNYKAVIEVCDSLTQNGIETIKPVHKADLLHSRGRAYLGMGDHLSALADLNEAELIAHVERSTNLLSDITRSKTVILRDLGRFSEALDCAKHLMRLSQSPEIGPRTRFYAERSMSSCLKMVGDVQPAQEHNARAENLNERLLDTRFAANVAWGYADCYRYQRFFDKAELYYNRALVLYEQIYDNDGCLYTTMAKGYMYLAAHEFVKAQEALKLALVIAEKLGSVLEQYHCALGFDIATTCEGGDDRVKIKRYLEYYRSHQVQWAEAFILLVAAAQERDPNGRAPWLRQLEQSKFREFTDELLFSQKIAGQHIVSSTEGLRNLTTNLVVRLF